MGRTLLEILHRGDDHRAGMPREHAARALDRYELARAAEQTFDSLSGGQQARFQILLLELSRGDAAAARRADRQPRPALRRGAGGGAGRLRGHRGRGDPRPVVRPRLRPVPRVRRGRRGSTSPTSRSGTRGGCAARADGAGLDCKILQKLAAKLRGTVAGPPSLRSSSQGVLPVVVRPSRDVAATSCDRPTQWRVAPARPAAPTPLERPWPDPVSSSRGSWPRSSLLAGTLAARTRSSRSRRGRADRDGGRLAADRARLLRRLAGDVHGHDLTREGDSTTYSRDLTVPAGSYEFKVAINDGWAEPTAPAAKGGANIPLTLAGPATLAVHVRRHDAQGRHRARPTCRGPRRRPTRRSPATACATPLTASASTSSWPTGSPTATPPTTPAA